MNFDKHNILQHDYSTLTILYQFLHSVYFRRTSAGVLRRICLYAASHFEFNKTSSKPYWLLHLIPVSKWHLNERVRENETAIIKYGTLTTQYFYLFIHLGCIFFVIELHTCITVNIS